MVKENIFGQMAPFMLEILLMDKDKVMENGDLV